MHISKTILLLVVFICSSSSVDRTEISCDYFERSTLQSDLLATRSELELYCGGNCGSVLGLYDGDVCKLHDGQLVGSEITKKNQNIVSSQIQETQESINGCFINCVDSGRRRTSGSSCVD